MNYPIRNTFLSILLCFFSFASLAHATKQEVVVRKAELDVTFTMQQEQYNATDVLNLVFTVTNITNKNIQLFKWNTPLEGDFTDDMLSVEQNGKPLPYIGKVIKRAPPQANDYMMLAAGQSTKVSLDIATGYAIEQAGRYNVTFKGKIYQVVDPENGSFLEAKLKDIQSTVPKVVQFELTEKRTIAKERSKAATFTQCDASQQTVINTALSNAVSIANDSLSLLKNTPVADLPSADRYVTWFGAYTEARHSKAKTNFTKIHDALANQQVKFDCSCDRGYFAYVNIYDPYLVNLCTQFWPAKPTGTDSQAGTLVHEVSHFIVVANTDDLGYGDRNARNLALSNPDDALKNADNHEYFAENSPERSMEAGTFIAKYPDSYEADNTKETAKEILSGSLQNRSIVPVGDQDWLTFTLTSASDISIETSGVKGDTVITLYNEQDVKIAENDDVTSSIRFSKIVQPNLQAGKYYVKIIEYGSNDDIGAYVVNYTIDAVTGPVANSDTATFAEDGSKQLNPLDNDTHAGSDTLSIYSINGAALTQGAAQNILVPHGAVAINANGVMTFTPEANYHGVITFPYVITDVNGVRASASQQITITAVNDRPSAVNDNYSVEESSNVSLTPLTGDTDIDGDTLSIKSINGIMLTHSGIQVIAVSNGSVTINATGEISYKPQDGFKGESVFPYTVTDGKGGSATAELKIIVTETERPSDDKAAGGSFDFGFLFLLGVIGIYSRKREG